MKKRKIISIVILAIVALTVVGIILVDNKKTPSTVKKIDPGFVEHIAAYTSGLISTESEIKIRLTEDIATEEQIGKEIDETLFKFKPNIDGKAIWEDSRTISFVPDEKLPYKQPYHGKFMLSKIKDVSRRYKQFDFYFQTMAQTYTLAVNNIKPYDVYSPTLVQIEGEVTTSDRANTKDIEETIKSKHKGKKLDVKWSHSDDGKTHTFVIDSVERKDSENIIDIYWDASYIGLKESGEKEIKVPAIDEFILMKAYVKNSPEQCLVLQFSDPLSENQNLNGLIKIGNQSYLNFVTDKNEIRVFTSSRQSGEKMVTIYPEIKNIEGKTLGKQFTELVSYEEIKPAVRLVGKGVILPNSNGLIFPFEAVNLRAVDVTVLKIFEDNIAQFLQVNNLEGERELSRVGRVVLKKKIPLLSKDAIDYANWNRFFLDLSKLIETEPGAIYKVTLGFKRSYSLYHCEGVSNIDDDVEMVEMESELDEEEEYYGGDDYYDDYYYDDYYYYDYNWEDRDNPCKEAYYGKRREVSRNILASDIGLIAKRGADGSMHITATDIRTTEPLSGIKLELYDYQQQLVGEVDTDGDGKATIKPKGKAFLLVAKHDAQRGYLKLQDGNSLSMSMFDVSGVYKRKGLNGFLYGERGVWRPGDTIYLTFILEDKEQVLPKNHPVIFEISNPRGDLIDKQVERINESGFYSFVTYTDMDAPTGNYSARVKVGGTTYYKSLKVETVKPNRLKINLEFKKDKITVNDNSNKGEITVKWLHGAVARSLRTKVDVTLNKSYLSFDGYKDYIFNDPASRFYPETQNILDQRLDENGKTLFTPDFDLDWDAPGVLNAYFTIKAFEEGGNFSIDKFKMPYYPYTSYVGINPPDGDKYTGRLLTDKDHSIEIANVDAEGKAIQSNNLTVKVYKVGWRWWWDRSSESYSNYVNSSYYKPLQVKKVKVVNGKAKFNFKIDYPEWGRYLVRVTDETSGHSTGDVLYIDWPGWASRISQDNNSAASMLTFSADKEKYNVGEEATLTIPSPAKGRALVSIESGTKVVQSYWTQLQKGQTTFKFPITAEMAPNVYCHVTLLQPHAQSENDLPIRLYGVIPINVEDPNTHLKPILTLPEVFRPETTAEIKIKEENGKPMTYTIAIVDDGLLDLTHFTTPDPWSHFYAKQALGVKTWDLYDFVMGAFGGQLERLLSIGGGGDEDGGGEDGARANRFKPMVKFIGPFTLGKNDTETHKIDIPQYVGSVRTMVIAGHKGAYGAAEKTTPVRNPLMILGTLPRVVGPGEEVNLPITVFAMEDNIKNVKVSIKANDKFTIIGNSSKNITFNKTGDQVVFFKLKVKEELGVGTVEMLAESGSSKARDNIELDVRNPNPRMVTSFDTVIEAGKTWTANYHPFGIKGTNSGVIEISAIPPIDLGRRLKYLLDYPHGCIEQTTSSVFPQLYLSQLLEVDDKMKKKIQENVEAGIKRIQKFQTSEGGFSYWPGNYESNEWGSNYAGHFLLEAEQKGFAVPSSLKNRWLKYQKKEARRWTGKKSTYYNSELIQAYRLYTLALANKAELAAMNRMREMKDISFKARWRLAAAYSLAGKESIAKEIIKELPLVVQDYRELSYTYGSGHRDRAMILETLSLLGENTKGALLVKEISKALSNQRWMSTQTTAYCLLAVAKFVDKGDMSKQIKFSYSFNNSKEIGVKTEIPLVQKDIGIEGKKDGTIKVKNTGAGILYARLILEGLPVAGEEMAQSNDLQMTVKYQTSTGNLLDPSSIEQGTDFMAIVTVTNPGLRGEYREMALTQIFPSGWEIHNTRMDDFQASYSSAYFTYQDIRDDRVYTYFHLGPYKSKTFRLSLNASYAGKFYMPGTNCEAMYDASINARNKGQWVSVKPYDK